MAKKQYNIGLDIGDTSLGWAVSEIVSNDNIVVQESGVLRWSKLVENADKRNARSAARMSRRRKNRRKRLIKLFIEHNILTNDILNLPISEILIKEYNFTSEQIEELKLKNEYELSITKIKKDLNRTVKANVNNNSEVDKLFNKLNLIVEVKSF